MELWVTEYQTPNLGFSCKSTETLRAEQTPFQQLAVVDTVQFGRMMLLDGMVMLTEKDEFVYHEMITNIALHSHPNPEKVLIIGGGDGGTLREVVRHPDVKEGILVEIDGRVIQASRDFFPALAVAFDDPKAKLIVEDGIKYVKEHKNEFDIIIIDSTEPVGPAVELFSAQFYKNCSEALKEDGMLVVQSESPFINEGVIKTSFEGISGAFQLTKLYLASIPTYPSGLWSFTVGSKKHDPEEIIKESKREFKYYSAEVHQAAFKLPAFVKNIVKQGE